jgi:glycosyltransferase involved in cell wall biosynthesis
LRGKRPLRVFMMDLWCIVPYYTTYLCHDLKEQGVNVTLGSITYQYDRAHFVHHGIDNDPGLLDVVSRFEIRHALLRRGLKFLESCVNMVWLALRFLVRPPDVLHVQYLQLIEQGLPFELWLIAFARRLGIKLVYTVHNELPPDTGERHRQVLQRIYGMMDALICHSEAARDRLIAAYGVAPERIRVIPHGPLFEELNRPNREEARAQLGLESKDCMVLWQGWVKPYKGVPFLLDAWCRVQEQCPDAKLIIAGSGDEELLRDVRERVANLGLRRSVKLEFRFLDVAELPCHYVAADVLVYPYREITTSGALMTGLNYGKPIVATNLAAFREDLGQGGSALLVDYGDTDALSGALVTLIEDAGLRARLGSGAAEVAARSANSWQSIACRTYGCYKSLLVPVLGPEPCASITR